VNGNNEKYADLKHLPNKIDASELTTTLNSLYAEWELVCSIPEVETAFPNFGDKKYVTGIRPNTKTTGTVLIFRRRK
jgi:hypothetical protein